MAAARRPARAFAGFLLVAGGGGVASTLQIAGLLDNTDTLVGPGGPYVYLGTRIGAQIDVTGTLVNAGLLAGILEDVAPQVTIDFLNQHVTYARASASTLYIGERATTYDLALGTSLPAGTTLNLASDGHGGTDLDFGHG